MRPTLVARSLGEKVALRRLILGYSIEPILFEDENQAIPAAVVVHRLAIAGDS